MKLTETLLANPSTRFVIATGLFTKSEYRLEYPRRDCYTPLSNPANDVHIGIRQLMLTDRANSYPILMDYIRNTIAYLLVGHTLLDVNSIVYTLQDKLCPSVFTERKTKQIEVYDVAEALDDVTLYSAQLGIEYLRLIGLITENIDAAIESIDTSWDFKHNVWHNFKILKDYARRLLMSRWYRVYLENNFPNPDYVRIREDCFNYIKDTSAEDFIKEYPDIKKCISEHPDYFFDNKCL